MLSRKKKRGKGTNKGMRAAFGVSGAKLEALLGVPTVDDVQRDVREAQRAEIRAENERIKAATAERKLREAWGA